MICRIRNTVKIWSCLLIPNSQASVLYTKLQVNAAIREVDPDRLLFWEGATWSHWAPSFDTPAINKMLSGLFSKYPALTWLDGISRLAGNIEEG